MQSRQSQWLLLVAGICGATIGAFSATWQWAVEIAQLHAGIVAYQPNTLATAVQAHLWSLLHQLIAVALRAGASEYLCSVVLSALLSALALQAVSLLVFIFGRDVYYALLSALLIVITGASSYGVAYPIDLLPTPHSYGAVGLALCALVVALAGNGWFASAAFLAGVSIAVHPPTGAWTCVVLGVVGLICRRQVGRHRRVFMSLAAGLLLSGVSLLFHAHFAPPLEAISGDAAASYVRTFINYWDLHRQPVRWGAAGIWFNVASVLAAGLFLSRAPSSSRIVLWFLVVSGASALLVAGIASIWWQDLPLLFLAAIPGRFLNFDALLLAPVLFGLIGRLAATHRSLRWLSLAVATALVACARGPLRGDALYWPLAQWPTFQPYVIAALAIVVILLVARGGGSHRELSNSGMDDGSPIALWILPPTVVACAILIVSQLQGSEASGKSSDTIRVANGDKLVLEQASRTPGALLTGGNLWLVQLRTRRAVVLDPATLDTLPYAVEGAPYVVKVLEDAYGVSFFNPPVEGRHLGQLARTAGRTAWEQFTSDDWRRISSEFGVSQILTYRDWTLNLPVVVHGRTLSLYGIPPPRK